MSLLGEISYALIQPSARAIGQIYADVTVEEVHRDEVIITQHPIEGGGVITDHAYKRPAELEIRCGFSNSSAGYVGYVQEQYRALLALQLARQPFTVYTGKRRYRNMLIRGISVATDGHSENILMASVALQEVILVSTQTTRSGQGGSTGNGSGNGDSSTASPGANANQANPASTGSVTNSGSVEATGVGSQAFAGSFNPGSYSPDGGSVGNGSFGLSTPGADLTPQTPQLSGISPPASVTLPEISVAPTIGGLQAAGPDQYNMFGGGP
ncbi:phage baseplate protein [Methylobacterium fujisawaense]|uniref:phage baseplate protein n=1 Tax=Methylobacterium fujisawaense TaxID=107400 RepID=UPI00313DEB59